MNWLTSFGILVIPLLSSCQREVDTIDVTFMVKETSPASPSYSIIYTSDVGGSSAVASSSSASWTSGELQLKQGQYVSLKSDCTAPQHAITVSIYVNGYLWTTADMQNPNSTIEVNGNIPMQ
jgi:hypothetical protein